MQQGYQRATYLQLQRLLQQDDLAAAKVCLEAAHPADVSDAITHVSEKHRAIAFRLLPKNQAIEVFEHLDRSIQQSLLQEFRQQEFLDIVDQMSPDDRAQLFDEMPAKVVRRLMQQLSPAEWEATQLLLGYQPCTAGRRMTPEYVVLQESVSVDQAIDLIRQQTEDKEIIYYLYVVDHERRLTGIVSLRTMLIAQPKQQIRDIMTRAVISVQTDTDQEEVARLIQRYDFLAIPVVDREQRLVGIVTVDDVLDILQQETTEDIYALGGLQAGENYFQSNLLTIARRRVSWLLILLVTNTGTTAVIQSQEEVLEQVVALAAFIPLLIDTGGNVGAQSSTVVIRGLNTEELRLQGTLKIVQREAITGAILGLLLGSIVTIWAFLLQRNWQVALSVGLSLWVIALLASIAGSALPFLFYRLKLDPALMSAPFITTAVDVLGVLIYLLIARQILQI